MDIANQDILEALEQEKLNHRSITDGHDRGHGSGSRGISAEYCSTCYWLEILDCLIERTRGDIAKEKGFRIPLVTPVTNHIGKGYWGT